jgi:phosphomannomutase
MGLQVAALVAQDHNALEGLAEAMPRFPQVIASAHLTRRVPLEEVSGLQALIDSALAAFDHQGRIEVRYSGTEPNLMRAMVEGGLKSTQQDVIAHALAICNAVADAGKTDAPRIDMVDCATGNRIDLDTN